MKITIAIALACALGCTENSRSKTWGGTSEQKVPCDQKVFDVTWKGNAMWVATVAMGPEDKPRSITFAEDSSWGLMEGTVVLVEERCR